MARTLAAGDEALEQIHVLRRVGAVVSGAQVFAEEELHFVERLRRDDRRPVRLYDPVPLLLKRPALFPDSGQLDGMEPLRQWGSVGRAMLAHDNDGRAAAGLDEAMRKSPEDSEED